MNSFVKVGTDIFLPEMLCIVVLPLKTANYSDLKGFTFDVYLTV